MEREAYRRCRSVVNARALSAALFVE